MTLYDVTLHGQLDVVLYDDDDDEDSREEFDVEHKGRGGGSREFKMPSLSWRMNFILITITFFTIITINAITVFTQNIPK